jgi:N-acetylneuraminic acid mutarotase
MIARAGRIVLLVLAFVAQFVLALPATAGGWSTATSLADGRTQLASVLLPHGRLLVAGGFSNMNATLSSAFLYDYGTDIWSSAGSMSTARESPTATLLPSGKVLITGGFEPIQNVLSSAEIYDPSTNSWSSASAMSVTRGGHTATLLPRGKVLVVGGVGGEPVFLPFERRTV